jgi:hypothetical protein
MRRCISIATLLVTLAAGPAAALDAARCCACFVQHAAMTSGGAPAVPALFCEIVAPGNSGQFEDQCDAAGGNASTCVMPAPGQTCPAALSEQGIVCPAPAAAPAAAPWALSVMVLLLIAVARFATRRRIS